MHFHLGGQEPNDPSAASMHQLVLIAATYASATAGAAVSDAGPVTVVVIVVGGIAHTVLTSWHGIKRDQIRAHDRDVPAPKEPEQDGAEPEREADGDTETDALEPSERPRQRWRK